MSEPVELQKEIDRLKADNDKLKRDLAGVHDDLKEVRAEARDRRHENKKLAEQLEGVTGERDKYKVASEADPEGLKTQITDLSGKLLEINHRGAFADVARSFKVTDPGRINDLYALSGYKPEGEPDTAKLEEAIGAALTGRPHFLDPPPGGAAQAAGAANGTAHGQLGGKPGVGSDRGQSTHSERSSQARERIAGRL
jgi:hypothetical protein